MNRRHFVRASLGALTAPLLAEALTDSSQALGQPDPSHTRLPGHPNVGGSPSEAHPLHETLKTHLAEPSNAPGPVVWRHLTTAMASLVTQGWLTTRTDASIAGGPIRIAGKHYPKGLGTHAPGVMLFPLNRKHHRFVAEVGVDDAGGPTGSVVFEVFLDGKQAFNSGLMRTAEIANDTSKPRRVPLRSVLEAPEGHEVVRAESLVELAPGASHEIIQPLEARNVRLWHPDDPYLHFIRTEVVEGTRISDSLRTRFGIRLFEMRGIEGLFVNRSYVGVKLSGVNRHQDYPYIGNAHPKHSQWRDVKILREGGVNVIRAAHYPQSPAFYDACDELGMLVTTANPGWQFFNFQNPIFEQRLYDDTRHLVRRDRNRPSMLLWETAINETPDQPARVLARMHEIAHEEYPFPGMYTVADVDEARKGGLDFYYFGPFSGPINSFTREYGDGGEVDNFYSQNATTRVKREWGEGPLLLQAAIRARDLDGVYAAPRIQIGAALWCGIDHQRGYHPDPFWGGLLDEFRIPRYAYYLFKSQYAPDYKLSGIQTGPMVYITHELSQVSGGDVVIYSNCQQVRLTWLGNLVGTQEPDSGYHAMPSPPFTFKDTFDFAVIKQHWRDRTGEIEMIAEGLIDGQVVSRTVKKYPERTTAVQVIVDDAGAGLAADGSDFVPVRAVIVDNKGVPKVLASEYVFFEVDGPAEIVGGLINQANPVKTEFGVATALIRAKTAPGIIRVRAYVRGLSPGEAYLASSAPPLPLWYDSRYVASSKAPETGNLLALLTGTSSDLPTDVAQLQQEVQRLQRAVTSKEQDIMDLRNKLGR